LNDLTKSTGLVKIDLDKLVLTQQKRVNEMDPYGDPKQNEKQNEHARAWLEIDKGAPPTSVSRTVGWSSRSIRLPTCDRRPT
jgi:hypothetical protein